jgi:hypothetical protein
MPTLAVSIQHTTGHSSQSNCYQNISRNQA